MCRPVLVPMVILALTAPPAASADTLRLWPGIELEDGLDADVVLRAVRRAEILPLDRVLDVLRTKRPGEIVEIELDLHDGRLIYDFDVLSPEGRLYAVEIDAVTGRVLDVELEDDYDYDYDDYDDYDHDHDYD